MGPDLGLVFIAPFIVAFALVVLLIIFWRILRNKYAATPADFSKNKSLRAGCGSLIVSFTCLVTIPITFVMILGVGMGADDSSEPAVQIGVALLMIGLLVSIAITITAGITGVVRLVIWAIKKYKEGLP